MKEIGQNNYDIESLAKDITEKLVEGNQYSLEDLYAGINILEILLVLYEMEKEFILYFNDVRYSHIANILNKDNHLIVPEYALEEGIAKSLVQDKVVYVLMEVNSLLDNHIYQALLDIQKYQPNLIIILIDEQESLLRHHTSMDSLVKNIRISRSYTTVKKDMKRILQSNKVGEPILDSLRHIRNALKSSVIESTLFSELGLNYTGPINGHNTKELRKVLSSIEAENEPQVIHFQTRIIQKWLKDFTIPTYKIDNELPINYYDFNLLMQRKVLPLAKEADITLLITNNFNKTIQLNNRTDLTLFNASIPTLVAISKHYTANILLIDPKDAFEVMQTLKDMDATNLIVISSYVGKNKYESNTGDLRGASDLRNLQIYQGKNLMESYLIVESLLQKEGVHWVRFEMLKEEISNISLPIKNYEILVESKNDTVLITYGSNASKINTKIKENNLDYGLIRLTQLNVIDTELLDELKNIPTVIVVEMDSEVPVVYRHLLEHGIECVSINTTHSIVNINDLFTKIEQEERK